eukprot:9377119-Lingulodinium_polyedra.AAC.1
MVRSRQSRTDTLSLRAPSPQVFITLKSDGVQHVAAYVFLTLSTLVARLVYAIAGHDARRE